MGWKPATSVVREPNALNAALVFTHGTKMVRVRLHDCAWAFYTEISNGKNPDRWGKDYPSFIGFMTSFDISEA
jgi:hypothetical protein